MKPVPKKVRSAAFVVAGLLSIASLVAIASPFAARSPDGLEKVSADHGFAETEQRHALADGPVADYRLSAVEDDDAAVGAAGALGVLLTFALTATTFWLLRVRRARKAGSL